MNPGSVKAFMEERRMLPEDETEHRILCACSGGADSVALLHVLRETPGVDVVCAHFNHCLRGAESDRDEEFVRELCTRLGVEFYAGRGDAAAWAAANRLSIEAAARQLRYAFLQKTAAETGCVRVATAHNAEDNAETVLWNLIRGAGSRGLGGIPPVRDGIIRPLLNVSRAEIEAYLERHGLAHVEDSSNASDDYTRNRLRHGVLPALRALNPGAVKNICSAAELAREDEAYLNGLAEAFLAKRDSGGGVSVSGLCALPKPVAMRALRTLCGGAGRVHLEAVYALCAEGPVHGRADLPGLRVTRDRDLLRFGPAPPPAPIPRRELRDGETLYLPEAEKTLRRTKIFYTEEIHNSFNTFYFKNEKICGKIYVASRGAGDTVRLKGRNCTKSLKKLFSEAKMPLEQRVKTLVFYDEAGVIGVEGFGTAQRCVPAPGERTVKIEIY